MSAAMAKEAREAMKAKAHRMAGPGSDKGKRIDASGWSEPTDMRTNAPTGMRPVSRRQFKDGGAVSGKKAATRTDRKSRADVWTNRDVRAANHEIAAPHIGGFKDGGATNFRKQAHGMMGMAENMHGRRNGIGKFHRSHKAGGGGLDDDLALVLGGPLGKLGKDAVGLRKGGRAHKAGGGSLSYDDISGMRPKGDREPRAKGGKTKGRTNIVIAINAGGKEQQPPPMMAQKPPMAPPAPPPMPPQGAGGAPQGGAPPGMGMPPGMPMPRYRGGKVVGAKYSDSSASKAESTKSAETMKVGAGGGLGRLAKSSIARKDGFKPV